MEAALDLGRDGDGFFSSDEDLPSDYPDDDAGFGHEADVTLASIHKSHTIPFPIRASYTKWKPWEAFREIVQNWRDAIIKSFNLDENKFYVIRSDKSAGRNTEIVFKVLHPNSEPKEWLGYIRFKGRDGLGTVEIANRKAILQPYHLVLGGTTKDDDTSQAGEHGEGLKLALLVLMRGRQNHLVRCRSGGFMWTFNFTNRGHLVAHLRRMSPERIRKVCDMAAKQVSKTLLPVVVSPEHDVQFFIGERGKGKDGFGRSLKRDQVKLEEFEDWLKAALFLQNTEGGGRILSKRGDLITDDGLRGNVYLKGLLLQESHPDRSASVTGKVLKYGYNFSQGETNRERQSLLNARKESQAIQAIWHEALRLKPPLIEQLSSMLNSSKDEYADVSMVQHHIKVETACRLKEYLFGEEFAGKWYYSAEEKAQNPRLSRIIQGLGCEGVQLTNTYWSILESYNLIRSAGEEEERLFLAADVAHVPHSQFARDIQRSLLACVRACPQTNHMSVEFVRAGELDLDSFYLEEQSLLKIHSRWLTSSAAMEELGLPADLDDSYIMFHTVKRLFAEVLQQVPEGDFQADGERTSDWYLKRELSLGEQRLLNYMNIKQKMQFESSSVSSALTIKWPEDLGRANNTRVSIQLHRINGCSHLRDLLLSKDIDREKITCIQPGQETEIPQAITVNFTCRSYTFPLCNAWHMMQDPDQGVEYFAIFSIPADPESFAVVTENSCVMPRKVAPLPESQRAPRQIREIPRNTAKTPQSQESPASSSENSQGRATSRSPTRSQSPSPTRAPSQGPRSPAVENRGRDNDSTRPEKKTTFTLGKQLESLDIFKIDKSHWFEAVNVGKVEAVIGVLNPETVPDLPRKRARVVVEIDDED